MLGLFGGVLVGFLGIVWLILVIFIVLFWQRICFSLFGGVLWYFWEVFAFACYFSRAVDIRSHHPRVMLWFEKFWCFFFNLSLTSQRDHFDFLMGLRSHRDHVLRSFFFS